MPKSTAQLPKIRTIRPDHYDRLKETTHVLYRCYTKRKVLLYVGMTNHPEDRLAQHRKTKPWWKYVDHITLQGFPSRKALAEAESIAIQTENPQFNILVPRGAAATVPRCGAGVGILWPHARNFGTVQPEHGFLIEQTLEQQLYPCVECHARAIYCEGDTVACKLCSSEWTFDQWFEMTFKTAPDTKVGDQMTLM